MDMESVQRKPEVICCKKYVLYVVLCGKWYKKTFVIGDKQC